jgi:spermidine synthase
VSTLYLFDLVGAGLGCVLVVILLNLLGAPAAMIASAFLFGLSGALFRRGAGMGAAAHWAMVLSVALLLWQLSGRALEPRYNKGRSDTERVGQVLDSWWNSHSSIKVYAIAGQDDIRVIDIDGSASTGMMRLSGRVTPERVKAETGHLKLWLGAPPYAILGPRPKVLIIGPGGGREILTGLHYDAEITAVEINRIIYDLMTEGPYAEWSGHVYSAPGVTAIHDEARSWIRRSDRRFNLIQATLVDTWAATASGAFALSENALYTIEAFEDYWTHLSEDGVVHFTRWQRDPPRETLRTLVLMVEVMKRHGITEPDRHIAVLLDPLGVRDGGEKYASMIWSRRPFTEELLGRLQSWVDERARLAPDLPVEPCWLPGQEPQDDHSRFLTAPDQDRFIAEYPFDIRPTTDDRPFFFNTVRVQDVATFRTDRYLNEQAVVVLMTVLFTVAAIVVLAFVLPFAFLYRRTRRENGPGTPVRLLYFCGLGLGFMLVEIPVLQRFGLYLGHPTYALTTILATLLTATGLGSALAGTLSGKSAVLGARVGLVLLIAGIAALTWLVPDLLQNTLAEPLEVRILWTVSLLGPLGILMGFPFPLGIRALEPRRPALVPWAWGMNGATSVLASVLAVALGMYAGFTVALLAGAAAYAVCVITAGRLASPFPAAEA